MNTEYDRCMNTTENQSAETEAVARRPFIVADTLDDHRPTTDHDGDFTTCSCDGTRWETADWRLHVGQAAVANLDEDAEHYRLTPPGEDR